MSKLHEYRTFVTIVERKSLTQAAEKLHRSTSTISKQLAKLEEDLGVTLIDRTTQSIMVTNVGEEFYYQCKEILKSVDEAERSVRDRLKAPAGKLSISIPEVLLRTELLSYLSDFTRKYKDVKLNLSISNQVEDLIEHQYDFAFRIESLTDVRLVAIPIATANLVAVASPDFIDREGVPENLAALVRNNQLILPSYVNIPRISRLLGPVVGDEPAQIESCHSATSEGAILEMVRVGMGVALLLDVSAKSLLCDGSLVQL
ncbi:MAG: LysR family transcriptional regulator, partial [Pseudomonadales bacterium]